MKIIIILSIIFLTSCATSQQRIENKYNKALVAIQSGDYDSAFRLSEWYYSLTKNKEDAIKKLKTTFSQHPEVLNAGFDISTSSYFQSISKKGYGIHNIRRLAGHRVEFLKIFDPEQGKEVEKKYISFFGNSPEFFKTERKKFFENKKREERQKLNFKNFSAKGNLAVTQPISCIDINNLKSSHTPADIFTGVSDCIQKDDVYHATRLYSLALTYGHYDKLRMVDKTARGAISVLRLQHLSSANKDFKVKFNVEMKKYSGANKNAQEFKTLCEGIQKLGKPNYYPKYMIRHGMSAFTGKASGVLSDFNEEKAWKKSTEDFLKCS